MGIRIKQSQGGVQTGISNAIRLSGGDRSPVGGHREGDAWCVYMCPSGDVSAQFLSMLQKGQKWIDRAVESHIHRRDIWFLLDHQLWP